MAIELTPPVIYATPGELAEAYMSEVERAWKERPAFALRVMLEPPEQVWEMQDVVAFWGQVQKRLPMGWGLHGLYEHRKAELSHGTTGRDWPDHDAWAS